MVVVSASCQLTKVSHRIVSSSVRLYSNAFVRPLSSHLFMPKSGRRISARSLKSDNHTPDFGRKRQRLSAQTMNSSGLSSASEGADYHRAATSQVRRGTCYKSEAKSGEFVVRVVSYNLLAQHQIDKNVYLYNHCPDEVLDWERRRDTLLKEMDTFACDIMCLQEVQVDHYKECLEPFFNSLGFESHFKNKTRKGYDGVAIVFRRSRFHLLAVEPVEYHRPNHPVLRADNVGLVLVLQPLLPTAEEKKASALLPPVLIANTHLYFNANRGDVKLAQLCLLLATMERLARRPDATGYCPIVLCGDLNAEPTSPLYRFLTTGRMENFTDVRKSDVSDQNRSAFWSEPTEQCLSLKDLPPPGVDLDCRFNAAEVENSEKEDGEIDDILRHHLELNGVYPVEGSNRAERRVTSFTAHDVCCVDHMFYTPIGMRLLTYCDTIRPVEFTRVAGIPNESHGSDHIPLIADFALRVSETTDKGKEQELNKGSSRL